MHGRLQRTHSLTASGQSRIVPAWFPVRSAAANKYLPIHHCTEGG